MGQLVATGSPALSAIVFGSDTGDARLQFYAEVMGLSALDGPDGTRFVDLGPGGAFAEALAELVMRAHDVHPSAQVRQRLGSLQVAASSRARAAASAADGLRDRRSEVTVSARRQAHAGFFGLEVLDLSHRRFDGTMSPVITREVFVSGDAVTVLPYDPVRDRVLVVEQFRMGPLERGDLWPWQLEAIAGRIDPGETPEEAARREAVEEAGLVLGRLEKVAEYYPSPGGMTEYIYSFLAVTDLPDGVAGVFGAEEEAEDIKGHLLSFEGLMAAVAGGRVANAPMILTALWLQRERGRLQR
jgi:nudix-type nucleoside diphosphatase (YffH/AdpP family)